jgi:four helix bundle protein
MAKTGSLKSEFQFRGFGYPNLKTKQEWKTVVDEPPQPKVYDLEKLTFEFAKRVRSFVKRLPRTLANAEDAKQLIKASGSVGANYIEANEALGKKDFCMRIRISRKEAKETRYWLGLLYVGDKAELEAERACLIQESTELMNILGAILRKSE